MKSGISAASDHEKPYAVRIAKSRGVEPCDKTGARRDWSQIPSVHCSFYTPNTPVPHRRRDYSLTIAHQAFFRFLTAIRYLDLLKPRR
jgi:hypothetical protein